MNELQPRPGGSEPPVDPSVLVVGAGPVGLTLACELLRHGVPCRVVDLADGPSLWSKAAVVHARTLEVFEAMGVADEALARGRRVHGIGLFDRDKRIGHVGTHDLDSSFPFMLGLSQRDTELVLEAHFGALGGRVERRVELCQLDGDVATLAHPDGRRERVRHAYLCACDGAHSTVRHALGVPFEGTTYEESVLQADVRIRWPFAVPDDEGLFFVSPAGPIGALPVLAQDRYRLVVLLAPEERADPTLPQFQRLLDERGPAGCEVSDPAWMVTFRFHRRMVPRYRVGRAFLVGDAAHVHSPVGGQGMNMGIQDAFNLAWKLALVMRGKGDARLLDSYHPERAPIAAATLRGTDAATRAATRVLGLKSPLARRLRDDLFGLVGKLPFVEGRVASLLGGVSVDYRDSPIVGEHAAPLGTPGAAMAPGIADWISFDRGPRPGERVADVDLDELHEGHERLHEVLRGTEHKLLLFPGKTEGYATLGKVAAAVEARWGALVKTLVVSAPGDETAGLAWSGPILSDAGGALRQRFGARSECLYLIRPDGYVGYRCQPASEEHLLAYLGGIFT